MGNDVSSGGVGDNLYSQWHQHRRVVLSAKERTFEPPDVNRSFVSVGDSSPIHTVRSAFSAVFDVREQSSEMHLGACWGFDVASDVDAAGWVNVGSDTYITRLDGPNLARRLLARSSA